MPVATIPVSVNLPNGTTVQDQVNKSVNVRRVILKQKGGSRIRLVFPFGPAEVSFDSYTLNYNQINRPDLKPMLVNSGPSLQTVSFNAFIADRPSGATKSIQSILSDLQVMASEDEDCEFIYGLYSLDFSVRITSSSIAVTQRDATGAPLKASAAIQLTESIEIPNYGTTLLPVIGANAVATPPTVAASPPPPKPAPPDDGYEPVCLAYSSDNPACGTRQPVAPTLVF